MDLDDYDYFPDGPDDLLLDFPSYPNLTFENQLLFTKFATMLFRMLLEEYAVSSTIRKSMAHRIVGTNVETYKFVADFNIKLGEFLKLPEIAGLIYCVNLMPDASKEDTYHHYYTSIYSYLKEDFGVHQVSR